MRTMLFVFAIIFLIGCDGEKACLDGEESFKFLEDKEISIKYTGNGILSDILEGERLVFVYNLEVDCKDIIDEETFEEVAFAVDSDLESFNIETEEEFENARAFLDRDGAWFQFTNLIKQGKISGNKRSNNRWEVTFDLQLFHPGDTLEYREMIFTETFRRE